MKDKDRLIELRSQQEALRIEIANLPPTSSEMISSTPRGSQSNTQDTPN